MDMEASADRSKIPKDVWELIWQTRSPSIARQAWHADVASHVKRRVSVLGERNAVAATHIDHSKLSELGSKRV